MTEHTWFVTMERNYSRRQKCDASFTQESCV